MPVYNTIVPVVALVRADTPEEAERLLAEYVDSLDSDMSSLPVSIKHLTEGTFESEPVPEDHVLHLPKEKD